MEFIDVGEDVGLQSYQMMSFFAHHHFSLSMSYVFGFVIHGCIPVEDVGDSSFECTSFGRA
jgi:hypothetical protein